jgi:hypothetical protein
MDKFHFECPLVRKRLMGAAPVGQAALRATPDFLPAGPATQGSLRPSRVLFNGALHQEKIFLVVE